MIQMEEEVASKTVCNIIPYFLKEKEWILDSKKKKKWTHAIPSDLTSQTLTCWVSSMMLSGMENSELQKT